MTDIESSTNLVKFKLAHPSYWDVRTDIMKITHEDGIKKNSRCRETYIANNFNAVYQKILFHNKDFFSFKEKLAHIIYQNGYCLYCFTRTKLCTSGRGFTDYCNKTCSSKHIVRVDKNKVLFDEVILRKMYLDEFKTPVEIGDYFGCSNVTVVKELKRLGISRSHSEQQEIHSNKDTVVWNYNGFDKNLVDIEHIKKQNKIKSISAIAMDIGCSPSTLNHLCTKFAYTPISHMFSNEELAIRKFLDNMNILYEVNNRKLIGKELDILLVDKKIAIEVNGVFWHSEYKGKHKNYHVDKFDKCAELGIQLLQFWDYEINEKFDLVTSILKAKLNLNEKIYARKCIVKFISREDAKEFCYNNHLQGYSESSKRIGLYFNEQLVSVGTFAKPRFLKEYDFELIRFCTLQGYTVIGGLSRVLSKIKGSVISYANKRISNGGAYESTGFELLYDTKPDFFYYNIKTYHRISRYANVSPLETMQSNGWTRVWGCGNKVYIIRNKEVL